MGDGDDRRHHDALRSTTRGATSRSRTDAVGNISRIGYDALGNITQTLTPNGAASFIEYDAAGMKVRAWTGGLPGQSAQQATNVAASAGGGLTISWQQPGADSQSWVVWDTEPHDVAGNAERRLSRTRRGHVGSGPVSVTIPGDGRDRRLLPRREPGQRRQPRAGPRSAARRSRPASRACRSRRSAATSQITVRFNASVEAPMLRFGAAGGSLGSSAAFDAAGPDGSYVATIPTRPIRKRSRSRSSGSRTARH